MDSLHTGAPQRRRGTYLNAVLTANAVLLGLVLVGNAPGGRAPSASLEAAAIAAPPTDEGDASSRTNAAEQRKQIIGELQNLASKVAALDARLKGPIAVKVVEMPKEKDSSKPSK